MKITVQGERVGRPDKELLGRVRNFCDNDDRTGYVRDDFQMGKAVDGHSIHRFIINIQHGLSDSLSRTTQDHLNWLDKYNIDSWEEYLRILTITTRDCNKNAKIKGVTPPVKKLCYQIKDWVIMYLFRMDYIDEIKGHEIDSGMYYLFYTKAKNENSMDGRVSFHIPLHRSGKFKRYVGDVEDYPLEEREYAPRETGIDNEERMQDFLNMVNSNLFDDKSTSVIKGYLDLKN